jgi:hypothetical protein
MHRLDRFSKLFLNRSAGSAARRLVTSYPPPQPGGRCTFKEDAEPEKSSDTWPSQQPKAFNENDRPGPDGRCFAQTGMGFKIVAGHTGGAAPAKPPQNFTQNGPIDGPGMVKIQKSSPGRAQSRTVQVKIIQTQSYGIGCEGPGELFTQPALS